MYNHAIELFCILFHQPRFISSDVENMWKTAMADARHYVYTKLCGFGSYVEIIANSSMCSPSYLFCTSKLKQVSKYNYITMLPKAI